MNEIIVTGASRGIGRAITETLIRDGFKVHGIARTEAGLKELSKNLSSDRFEYTALDLSNSNDIKTFTEKWQKPLYGIVNNAGICKTASIGHVSSESVWDEVVTTNLKSVFLLTNGLVNKLSQNGRIITISSQLGKDGRANYGAYAASKFGVIGLTKCWAKELGSKGITVNAVCPGWVKTEMSEIDLARIAKEQGKTPEAFYKEICEPLELKRFTEPQEVAELVAFLASSKASGITGRDMLMHTIWNQE